MHHPLFDERSLYRIATRRSVFGDDDGHNALRAYFDALVRRQLYEEWQQGIPDHAQEWGFGAATNRLIHAILLESAQQVPHPGPAEPVMAQRGASGLLVIDLESARDERPKGERRPLTTQPESPPFVGVVPRRPQAGVMGRFVWHIDGLPAGRSYVLILVSEPLARSLGRVLQESRIDYGDVPDCICAALTGRHLSNLKPLVRTSPPPVYLLPRRELPVGARLAITLSLAPALKGLTGDGVLRGEITLRDACPDLPLGTWAVLCLGPTMACRDVHQPPGQVRGGA